MGSTLVAESSPPVSYSPENQTLEGTLKLVLCGGRVQTAEPPSEEQETPRRSSGSVTEPLQGASPWPLIIRLRHNQEPLVHAVLLLVLP